MQLTKTVICRGSARPTELCSYPLEVQSCWIYFMLEKYSVCVLPSPAPDRWLICVSGHLQGPPGEVWGLILSNHRCRGWKESGAQSLTRACPGGSHLSLEMG